MKLTLLGSGGVSPTPRIGCFCKICEEARLKGSPYARTGPALFINSANLLFDAPEEIRQQLNREKIDKVEHLILTHWHPDHTLGIRFLEQLNWNFSESKPYFDPIPVYISEEQFNLFKKLSCGSFLDFYEKKEIIKIEKIIEKQSIILPGIKITPYPIMATKGFYFLIESGNKKIIYAPCEYHYFKPDSGIKGIDLFIVHTLFWENREISPRKTNPKDEDSFEQMLEHAKSFEAKEILLMHIEESFGLNHDEMNEKMKSYYPEQKISVGYDGMQINS